MRPMLKADAAVGACRQINAASVMGLATGHSSVRHAEEHVDDEEVVEDAVEEVEAVVEVKAKAKEVRYPLLL